jgi:hypothetical protein
VIAITESELVRHQIAKYRETFPEFDDYWVQGIKWTLERGPDFARQFGVRMNPEDEYPPIYLVKIAAVRKFGIPSIEIAYSETEIEIELLRFTIRLPKI